MVQKKIASQREEFDSIMNCKKRNIEYLSPENLISAIQSNFGDKDIEELLDVEKKLRQLKKEKAIRERQQQIDVAQEEIMDLEPCFPFPSGPRDYQTTAFDNWKNSQGHLNNMLNPDYKYMAIDCYSYTDDNGDDFTYWEQLFYTP
jgi:hypothetical protein